MFRRNLLEGGPRARAHVTCSTGPRAPGPGPGGPFIIIFGYLFFMIFIHFAFFCIIDVYGLFIPSIICIYQSTIAVPIM